MSAGASIFTRLLEGREVSYGDLVAACDAVGGNLDLALVTTNDGGVKLRRHACSRAVMTRLTLLAVAESGRHAENNPDGNTP